MTIAETFDDHWIEQPGPLDTPCRIWQRGKNGIGYGLVRYEGRDLLAHRFAWEQKYGELPDGIILRHRCDIPACVNDGHCEPGTMEDNTNDARVRGRMCVGSLHPHSKLTEGAVRFARAHYKKRHPKYSLSALADMFGVSMQTMHGAIVGRSWKHV